MTRDDFLELVGQQFDRSIAHYGGDEDLTYPRLTDCIQICLKAKFINTLDKLGGKVFTVLLAVENCLILESEDAICQISPEGWEGAYLDTSNFLSSSHLNALPKGTIGRWLHPNVETEYWHLLGIRQAEIAKSNEDRERAARLAQFNALKAEFEGQNP